MIGHRDAIFICGSKGMLVMVMNNETIPLDIQSNEDIRQMTLFKYNNAVTLAAFSQSHMFLFIDVLKVQISEATPIKVCGQIFSDKNAIYLPVAGGDIKTFSKNTCEIKNHVSHSHGKVRFFVPCTKIDKTKALVSLEDKKLYKTLQNDFDLLEVIDGVKNVKNLLRFRDQMNICSSQKKVWLVDSTPSVVETLAIKTGVKYITTNNVFVVIVDESNKLYVYKTEEDNLLKLIHEQEFAANISAISLLVKKIFLLVLDEIVILRIQI